jgi:hypothetical protein
VSDPSPPRGPMTSEAADDGPRLGDDEPAEPSFPQSIERIRLGHGANCSSMGSVIDTLFATAAVGAAVFAAVVAALDREDATVVGHAKDGPREAREAAKDDAP